MNTKTIKKIVLLLIVTIVCIILAIVILKSESKFNDNYNISNSENNVISETNDLNIKVVTNKKLFYTINSCVYSYLDAINKNNPNYYEYDENGNYIKVSDTTKVKQRIYNLLSKEYLEKNNISLKDVYNYVSNIEKKVLFIPLQMNVFEGVSVDKYAVHGYIMDMDYNFIEYEDFIVNLDNINQTFSIEPINTNHKDINEIEIINNNVEIEKNDNNVCVFEKVDNEYIARQYINNYKRMAIAKNDIAYNYLDDEYKRIRFGNIDEYKKYIQNNINEIKSIRMSEYLVNNYNDYTEYVCKDQYGNLYIFKETAVMQYTLTLDTYTLENEKFTTTYEKSNDQKKVMMNVDKFFQMLNARDYKTSYEILDSGFKNNYFNTQEVYENYMRSAFPDHYKVEYTGFSNEGNILIQKVKLTSMENNTTMEKNIIMKLEEGTKFVMSFNIQ